MQKHDQIQSIVVTAFFAAVIFLGIQSFRIPLPAAFGTPFLHFGHIFVVLAILCLGTKRSAVAGVLGLIIFDLLNGYTHAIPNVLVSTIIKCFFVGSVYAAFRERAAGDARKEYKIAAGCAALYGITNIVVDFVWSVAELMVLGNSFSAAVAVEITSIPATIINAVFTVIGIILLYKPVIRAYRNFVKKG